MNNEQARSRFFLFGLTGLVLIMSSCTQLRYGTTSIETAFDNPITIKESWGEVYCGRGTVCAEVEVRRVDIEHRDGGRIEVTVHNRTGNAAAVQIALEILNEDGARVDSTTFQNLPVAPKSEAIYAMDNIFRVGKKVRVVLRQIGGT
jgi:hypothetical protein